MKKVKTLALSAAVAGVLMSGSAVAELTSNIGVTSNYIWRGITQNADNAAVSGGLDYAHESGVYAGIWVSNLAAGSYEQDVYLGYAGQAGDLSYDVGYIVYQYPLDTDLDFTEVTLGVDYKNFGVYVAQTIDSDAGGEDSNLYYSASADFDIGSERSVGLVVGKYNFDDAAAEDYTHFQLSLSKGDFTFAIDKNDKEAAATDDEARVSVSWSQEFAL